MNPLFDADAAAVSDLATHRRAKTTVADLDAAFRAELITDFVAVRRIGSWSDELRLLAMAKRYDNAHPDELSLFDELHAIELYGPQFPSAA
jgi:hypothetical protein